MLIPTVIEVAWDLALAAAVVALVATAQRRHWGWFVGIGLAALLGALAPTASFVMLVYDVVPLSLYHCGGGAQCNALPGVAVIVRALVPLVVLLYAFRPPRQPHEERE